MNLDRFSQPMSWEFQRNDDCLMDEVEHVEPVKCCGCGEEIIEGDDQVESEIWEDEMIHDDQECIKAYYSEVEKRAALGSNSRN